MAATHNGTPWFPEPSTPDDTKGPRGESPFSWYVRSSLPRAVAVRAFLNRNLDALPSDAQRTLYKALHKHWQSGFFELIVARTLQLLGASLTVEPVGRDGKRIDFVAEFPDGIVNVEAVSPVIDGNLGEAIKARNPLLDVLELLVPAGWGVAVEELPALGPNDSKRGFRNTLVRLFGSLSPTTYEPIALEAKTAHGNIRLRAWPKRFGDQPILIEPGFSLGNDTETRIRAAVRGKKPQARSAGGTSLVAVHAGGLLSEIEDFDHALYGRTTAFVSRYGGELDRGFQADGIFATLRSKPPVFAGLLAFVRVGFRPFADPVLYLHPRFRGTLPEGLQTLDRRNLAPNRDGILIAPGQNVGFLSALGFLDQDV